MIEIEKARAFLLECVAKGAAMFLNADAPGVYWPIGAWRIEPRFFVLFVAGGIDQQAQHVLRFDEARMDQSHFLSFFVGGKFIGGVCEMDPDQKDEMNWGDYSMFLQTPEGVAYQKSIDDEAEWMRSMVINENEEEQ